MVTARLYLCIYLAPHYRKSYDGGKALIATCSFSHPRIMCCHMTQDHASNHATLNFRLLCKQRASAHVLSAVPALRPPSVFSASFPRILHIRLYMNRKVCALYYPLKIRISYPRQGPKLRNTRSPGGVSMPPSPNAAPVVEQRRNNEEKSAISIPKVFPSFYVSGQY